MNTAYARILTEAPRLVVKNRDNFTVSCRPILQPDVKEILYIRMRTDKDEPLSSRKSKIARVSREYNLQYARWMDMRYIISGIRRIIGVLQQAMNGRMTLYNI